MSQSTQTTITDTQHGNSKVIESFLGYKIVNKQADQYPQMVTVHTALNTAMPKQNYQSIKPVLSNKGSDVNYKK